MSYLSIISVIRGAPNRRLRSIAILFSFLVIMVFSATRTSVGAHPLPSMAAAELHILIPLYRYPDWWDAAGYIWDDIAAAQQITPITAIINPENGPGGGPPNEDYVRGLSDLQRAGVTMLGYIETDYGERDISIVLNDIALYRDHFTTYGVSGIFFDEVPATAVKMDYYVQLYNAVKAAAGLNFVVINPGTNAVESYLTRPAADLVIVADTTTTGWTKQGVDSYLVEYPAQRFGALLYAAPVSFQDARSAMDLAAQRNIGYFYMTDDSGANPWDKLPTFWNDLLTATQQHNRNANICLSVTELPTAECNALLDLYNSTNGDEWIDHRNWGLTTTPCADVASGGWYGVSCQNGHLYTLLLQANGLSGPLPASIGDFSAINTIRFDGNALWGQIPSTMGQLTTLEKLNLGTNNLQGPIPASFAALTNIRNLVLWGNQLTGTIPAFLQNYVNLQKLHLARNRFAGPLPSALCTVTTLTELTVAANQLAGPIPACLPTLQGLLIGEGITSFGYNAFESDDPTVRAFLDQRDSDWEATQTIAPTDLQAIAAGENTITVQWSPIPYQSGAGYYEARVGSSEVGPFTSKGKTADKKTRELVIAELQPATTYVIQVRTFSAAIDGSQQNELYSEWSAPLTVTTGGSSNPTSTPTPTAGSTPIDTPTATATPTATPTVTGQSCGGKFAQATTCTNFLPLVHNPLAPTAVSPTAIPPTPTASWQRFSSIEGDFGRVVIAHNALWAGERSENEPIRGLYQSASCALSAKPIQLLPGRRIQDIAFSGSNGVVATYDHRIHYTVNGGGEWLEANAPDDQYLAITFVNSGELYAGGNRGIYRSSDSGRTWAFVVAQGLGPTLINAITYDAGSDTIWIASTEQGVWKYQPGTHRFDQRNGGLPNDANDKFVWNIFVYSPTELYLATKNGVYRGNGEADWVAYELQGFQVYDVAAVANSLYAGTRDQGLYHTLLTDNPDWQLVNDVNSSISIRDLAYDRSGFCDANGRAALLLGTTGGIWIYR